MCEGNVQREMSYARMSNAGDEMTLTKVTGKFSCDRANVSSMRVDCDGRCWLATRTDINSLLGSVRRRTIDGSTHRFSMTAVPAAAPLCQMDDLWTASGCPNCVFSIVSAVEFVQHGPLSHVRTNISHAEVNSPAERFTCMSVSVFRDERNDWLAG